MKNVKTGVVLLALLLAAMAMVPFVGATGQNATTAPADNFATATVDVSKIQQPLLTFDKTQNPVTVNNEMTLDQTTTNLQPATLAAAASSPDAVKIPYGVIIRHSADGMTTVFDSTGKQLFSASDAKAAIINTPNGPARATHIQEVPDRSVIVDAGQKMYVFKDKALIMTVIDEASPKRDAVLAAAASTYPSQYIEGTETNVLPSIGQFIARWNVPKSPAMISPYPADGNPYKGSQVTIWNGVFGYVGSDPYSRLLQPVLEWYKKDKISDPNPTTGAWTMATWYLNSGLVPDLVHSTRRTLVYSGDNMQGNIQTNTLGYDAIASIADLGPQGGGSSTLFLAKTTYPHRMPGTNVQATVVLEGWDPTILPGLNGQYLCGSTTFQNFVLNDAKGNNILSTPMNTFTNPTYWNPTTFGLGVTNNWPSSIKLNTINN
jgi:hypothetical protein